MKKIYKRISLIVFLLWSYQVLWAQSPVENSIEKWIEEVEIAGVQIQHNKNGDAQVYAVGEMNSEDGRQVENSTIFQAASMSKVVFSYAILKLWDKGIIDIDIPLSKYYVYDRLDEEPDAAKKITARMALAHTTGFPNWQVKTGNPAWPKSKLKVSFEPGTDFQYSGEGFYYLQEVIEHITGKSLNEIMREEVFDPLGMKNSSFLYEKKLHLNKYAHGHDGLKPRSLREYNKSNSAFSMLTNVQDYSLFIQKAFFEKEGLSDKTYDEWIKKQSSGKARNKKGKAYDHLYYGLGVLVQENEAGKAIIHTGSNPGFRSFFIAFPDKKESLVYFSNSSNGKKIMEKVAASFLEPQTFWFLKR